jgi:hypothetical protein
VWRKVRELVRAEGSPVGLTATGIMAAVCALIIVGLGANSAVMVGAVGMILTRLIKPLFEVLSRRVVIWASQRLVAAHGSLTSKTKTRLSVTALLARQKSRGLTVSAMSAVIIFFMGWFEYGVTSALGNWAMVLSLCFLLCVLVDNVLLYYRIANGYFGNTELEAREIVAYILRNSESFNDDGGGFRIFDPAQTEKQVAEDLYGPQPIGAGQ